MIRRLRCLAAWTAGTPFIEIAREPSSHICSESSLACSSGLWAVRHHGHMAEDLRVTKRVLIPANELDERFSRSSGPGGQKVNTTDSRVELHFDVQLSPSLPEALRERALERLGNRLAGGVLIVTASQHRSQLHNRRLAREQLARILAEAISPPPKARRRTKPSRAAKQRRLMSKKHRGVVKSRRRRVDPGES